MSCSNLLCPSCHNTLAEHPGEMLLHCACGSTWHFNEGVAVLVPADLIESVRDTIAAFAFKWAFDPPAVSEERTRVATHWFYDRFGLLPDGEVRLAEALRGKTRILDAGCGFGNLLAVHARLAPQADVYGIDLSPAVHRVPRLHVLRQGVRLVQGDLVRLPIAGEFDWIVSDGVLHHTADTRESFLSLAKRLAPGGEILTYVYKRKAPIREFADDYIRERTTQMSMEQCLEFSRAMADLGRQLREARVTLRFERAIPVLGIDAGEIDLQRFIYWHFLKCFWDDGGNVNASIIENFDWYAPSIAFRHDPDEVRAWHAEAGLDVVRLAVGDSGISTWGRRPVARKT